MKLASHATQNGVEPKPEIKKPEPPPCSPAIHVARDLANFWSNSPTSEVASEVLGHRIDGRTKPCRKVRAGRSCRGSTRSRVPTWHGRILRAVWREVRALRHDVRHHGHGHQVAESANEACVNHNWIAPTSDVAQPEQPSEDSEHHPKTRACANWERLYHKVKPLRTNSMKAANAATIGSISLREHSKRLLLIGKEETFFHNSDVVASRHSYSEKLLVEKVEREVPTPFCGESGMLDPNGVFRMLWDLISLANIIYDFIYIPIDLAFGMPATAFTKGFNMYLMLFWSFDMLLSTRTGFINKKGQREMRWMVVLKRYLKSWFLLDCVVVGLDWYSVIAGTQSSAHRSVRVVRTARLVRSLRSLRLARVQDLYDKVVDNIASAKIHLILDLVKSMLMLAACVHVVGCTFYAIGDADREKGWLSGGEYDGQSLTYQYFTAFHWAMAQFTPSSTEVRPYTLPERVFNSCISFFGLAVFSSFISSCTVSVTALRSLSREVESNLHMLRLYMNQKLVHKSVAARVLKYAKYSMEDRWNHLRAADVPALAHLSKPLKMDLQYEEFAPKLSNHPFFRGWVHVDIQALRMLCDQGITRHSLAKHDVLFTDRSQAECMYFVDRGVLSYASGRDTSPVEVVPGQWCSELTLWCNWVHRGTLTATSAAAVLCIATDKVATVVYSHKNVERLSAAYLEALTSLAREEDVDDLNPGFSFENLIEGIHSKEGRKLLEHAINLPNPSSNSEEDEAPSAKTAAAQSLEKIKSLAFTHRGMTFTDKP